MIQILYQLSRGNITHTNTLNSAPAEQGMPPQKAEHMMLYST
jgi:hypothetical protein